MQDCLSEPEVAVISDIHGNLEALRAALGVIDQRRISQVLFLGDLLGYYYEASECLRLLQEFKLYPVLGNHEEMFRQLKLGQLDSKDLRVNYGSSLIRLLDVNDENIHSFIANLPLVRDLKFENVHLKMAHGDFASCHNYVYPNSSQSVFELIDTPGVDIVLLGNTHRQMFRVGNYSQIINPGSVGMSKSRMNNVQIAIINLTFQSVEFHNINYSPRNTLEQVLSFDPDCKILRKYLR